MSGSGGFEGPSSNERLNSEDLEEVANDPRFDLLIGPPVTLDTLVAEYIKDEVYLTKLNDLMKSYKFIRRVRPDGNCFFRGVAFAYLEYLLNHRDEYNRFLAIVDGNRPKLIELDYSGFSLDDIHDGFLAVLSVVSQGSRAIAELYRLFNDQQHSDYVVSYLRLVVSVHLRERETFYQNFMEDGQTVRDFCRTVVEPMNNESDHIHITALTSAFKIGIRVRYMDRSSPGPVNAHDFLENSAKLVIHLLYRPGHYDVLYPKDI